MRSSHISGIPSPRPGVPDDLGPRGRRGKPGGIVAVATVAIAAVVVVAHRRAVRGRVPDVAVLVEHLAHHTLEPLEAGGHALGGPAPDGLGRVLAEVRAGLLEAVCAWPGVLVSTRGTRALRGAAIEYYIRRSLWPFGWRQILLDAHRPIPCPSTRVKADIKPFEDRR